MNPRAIHVALVIAGLAGAIFVAGLVFFALFAGCATELPPEPGYVETVSSRAPRDR